ncbi:MAG: LuxR family transcriptional regulator [Actinophytocola sp.]|nr:LuxR family transcriptional regulator [Actinophytocola sp.]
MDGAFPAEVTSFIGRRHEMAELRRLLSSSRMVTLTGAGGVGKTRLATHAASEMQRSFADGAWLVELSALDDPRLLPRTVASAFGLRDEAVQPVDRLAEYLADKYALLVLDNCEHVPDAGAMLIGKLLAAAPELRVLATSRQRLGVEGEHLLPIEPFAIPSDGAASADTVGHESVSLFCDRAKAVAPGFDVTPENRQLVAAICRSVDGVPLAIELAAVWMRVLSLRELADRLDDTSWLTGGLRTAPARQQDLGALIDWSCQLCAPSERAMWARLSVFRGGFDLAAAEAVCAADGVERADVMRLLADLVDKSVLTRDSDTYGRGARYRMLGMLAQFGADRLAESGATEAAVARHRAYYRELGRDYAAHELTEAQLEWVLLLHGEVANVRAALESCLSAGDPAEAMALATDLTTFWIAGGHLAEGRDWLERALSSDTGGGPVRARALGAWLILGSWLGVHTYFGRRIEEYRELAESLGDAASQAWFATCEGIALYFLGEPERACSVLTAALPECADAGEDALLAQGMSFLTVVKFLLGHDDAEDVGRRGLALCQERGSPSWFTAHATWSLGLAVWRAGDVDGATELQRDGLRLRQRMRDHSGIALSLEALAWCAASARRYADAARLLGAAKTAWRISGAGRIDPLLAEVSRRHCTEAAVAELGDAAFTKSYAAGEALDLDKAIAMALGERRGDAGARSARPAEPPRLTKREREVAALVADGLSNKQIAAQLVISQRTAETHVEHILTKLGFTARSQVAAWFAATQGETDS